MSRYYLHEFSSPFLLTLPTALRKGEPAPAILELAESEAVEMIVMGTHGHTGLSRLLMGSVAEDIARRATCPVTLVKVSSDG